MAASENDLIKKYGRIVCVDPNDVFDYGIKEYKVEEKNGEQVKTLVGKDAPFTPPYEDLCVAFNLIIEKYDRFDTQKRTEIGMEWTDKPNGQTTHFSILDGELKTGNDKLYVPEYNADGSVKNHPDTSYLTTYYTEISPEGFKKKEMVEGLGVTSIQVNFDSYYTPTVTISFVDVMGSALFGREEAIHSSASGTGEINANNIFGAFFTIPYPKFRLQMKGFYGKDVTYQLTCSNFKARFNSQTGNVEATVSFVGYTWSILTDIPLTYLIAAPYCNYVGNNYWNEHKNSAEWEMVNDPKIDAHETVPPTLYDLFNNIRSCIKKGAPSNNGSNGNTTSNIKVSDARTLLNKIKDRIKKFKELTSSKKVEKIDENKEKIKTIYVELKNTIANYCEHNGVLKFETELPDEPFSKKADDLEYEVVDLTPLEKEVTNRLDELMTEEKKLIKEEQKAFIKKALSKIGIDPNVGNIFKILICHLETFCHILFEAGREIEQQKIHNERTPTNLGVNITKTDIPYNYDVQLPAWTAIFNQSDEEKATSDELKYSEMYEWVGNISHKWVEERVVWSLQNAIQQTALKKSDPPKTRDKKIYGIPLLPSDINLDDSVFSNIGGKGFYNLCGSLGIRATQLFTIMDSTLSNNINMVKILGEFDAYNYYLCCSSADSIKSQVLENISSDGNIKIANIATCDYSYAGYTKKGNEDKVTNYPFDDDHINENHHPIFLKENNNYIYDYFYDETNTKLVPSKLIPFDNRNYSQYFELKAEGERGICYKGKINSSKIADGWLYVDGKQIEEGVINNDMFRIIDDEGEINRLLSKYEEFKSGEFKVKDYTVSNTDGFKSFLDRYWHLSYDDYKKSLPNNLGCDFIGKSYKPYFNDENKKPDKNFLVKDTKLWALALDGDLSNTNYEIGDNYDKLKEGDLSEFFIKSLYVYDENGSSVGTLFGHPLYYTQNQIQDTAQRRNAKAFLFLQCLNRSSNIFNDSFNTEHGSFTVYNKLNILYIGGLLWRQKFYNTNKTDGIKYTNPDSEPRYKECVSNGNVLTIGSTLGLYEINEKTNNSWSSLKCVTISEYIIGKQGLNLDDNIKKQLIDYFEKFAANEFLTISNQCELSTSDGGIPKNGSMFVSKFINENKSRFLTSESGFGIGITNKNYAFYYVNMNNTNCPPKGIYCLFDEEGSADIQKIIKNVFFGKVVVMNNGPVNRAIKTPISVSSNVYTTYLASFIDTLTKIHTTINGNIDEYATTDLDVDEEVDTNILLAIYLYCKNIWEKWLMPMSGITSSEVDTKTDDMNENHFDVSHFFNNNFIFIDAYYNKIDTLLKINLDTLLKSYESRSVDGSLFSFIGDIASEHRCLFVGLPDFVDLGLGELNKEQNKGLKNMMNMFKPMPYNKMGKPRLVNHFVVIYTYPPASKLPDSVTHRYDGFDVYSINEDEKNPFHIANNDETYKNNSNSDNNTPKEEVTKYGYNVPCFVVAFSKQNNHLFKNFNISMDNPVETEQSIKTLYHVAELAKGSDRKVCFYGQDVYNIFSNYSYQIEVEMMGNVQIQPLMYMQLLNIPMWRGAYMIFNVSHTMTPGNMVTKFKAMKMSKNPVPLLSSYWSTINNPYTGEDDNSNGNSTTEGSFYYGEVAEQHEINTSTAKTREWLWGDNTYPR